MNLRVFNHIKHDLPKLERSTVDGVRLYKTPSGRAYPSVTTVTSLLNKDSIKEWRAKVGEEEANKITANASRRGTRIHGICEDYLNNESYTVGFEDKQLWKDIKPFVDRIDNIHALESPLFSDHLEVAGTVDCIAEYENELAVIDFKTSAKKKEKDWIKNYFMQCSAYAVAFEELTKIPVPNIIIIMGVDHEGAFIFKESRDQWIDEFKKLREKYKVEYGT